MSQKSPSSERAAQQYLDRAAQLRTMAKALPKERDRLLLFAGGYERVAASLTRTESEDAETVEV
jgi:hypothetical protein